MHFIVSFGIAAVIWLGSYLIVTHQITAGSFVSFIAALIMLYNPIKSIGNNFNSVQMALMAMERVFGVLERTPEIVNYGLEIAADPERLHRIQRCLLLVCQRQNRARPH